MSRRLDARMLVVDEQTYVIEVYEDKLLIAPCLRRGTSQAIFTPQSMVAVIPLSGYGTREYLSLRDREDEVIKVIRLHLLALPQPIIDPERLGDYLGEGIPARTRFRIAYHTRAFQARKRE